MLGEAAVDGPKGEDGEACRMLETRRAPHYLAVFAKSPFCCIRMAVAASQPSLSLQVKSGVTRRGTRCNAKREQPK